ncbi:hypothetical protein AB0I68_14795 [Streptomyces sp. NPDC050448]|uniref:hypothetical protein n=1 Tax=Streptomyces sp. NPDC050448 TaxID=3155404 RepID=UPI0034384484
MDEGESVGQTRRAHGVRRHIVAAVLTCSAVGAAAVHVIKPDLKIDGITVVLLAVAAVPWLGDLFDSIELPGGAKFQYAQLVHRIEASEERTVRIGRAVDGASRTARVALVAAGGSDTEEPTASAAADAVERLAAEYVRVRETQGRGSARTHRMERIFTDLLAVTPHVADFDIDAALAAEDPGIRLAAYARLYAVPDGTKVSALVATVVDEQLNFSQFWGLQAIDALVDAQGVDQTPLGVVRQLRALLRELPPTTDRAGVVQSILARFAVDSA